MIRLNNDYSEGCHPSILLRLNEMNLEQNPGYGTDTHCAEAADAVRKAFACPDADVHFLVGGTQANMTVIAAALRPYEAVLCADTGHINVHETGAVEGTGHKCIALQSRDGRISASQISVAAAMLDDNEHVAKPAMVYISMSTELGTVYNRAQLRDIYLTCQQLGLYLFIDGARLGYALAAPTGDLTAADIAEMCDVFTVGGTKMGALFGEAIVINHPALKKHFRHMMKHQGGLLAKGWLLGVQFSALMADGLYFQLGQKAVKQAMRIRTALLEKGIPLHVDSPTNQLFPIFSDEQVEALEEDFALEFQERVDESHVVLRVCTSWATPERNVTAFIEKINKPDKLIRNITKEYERLFNVIYKLIRDYASGDMNCDVVLEGSTKLLNQPEYSSVDKAKTMLELLETKNQLVPLIDSGSGVSLNIRIGKDENGADVPDCAVVSASYSVGGVNIGNVGVIGPMRMNYAKVVSVLDYIGKAIEELPSGKDGIIKNDNNNDVAKSDDEVLENEQKQE